MTKSENLLSICESMITESNHEFSEGQEVQYKVDDKWVTSKIEDANLDEDGTLLVDGVRIPVKDIRAIEE